MVTHPTRGPHPVVFLGLILTLLVAWGLTLAPPLAPGVDPLPAVINGRPVARVAAYYWAWAVGLAAGGGGAIVVLQRRRALSGAAFAPLLLAVVAFLVGARWQRRLETMPLLTALALDPRELFAPGMRISLGLLLGGLTACGGARILGAPWRAVGDAYALAASVVIPIGRIGCLLAGCCMGAVCVRWPAALCIAWPPGSEPFREQVVAGSIPLGAVTSLPVHPLPLYFALASLGTLGVLLVLLRGGARPGTLLLAFCVLRPAAKLALEPLRGADHGGLLMTAIPAAVLAVACGVLAIRLRPRVERGRRRIARSGPAALAALLVVAQWPTCALAQCVPPPPFPDTRIFYHLDHLESALLLTDGAGLPIETTKFLPYGTVADRRSGSGTPVSDTQGGFAFTGHRKTESHGLAYFQARYYAPDLGVFVSRDPAEQFPNPYTYGDGDPLNLRDLTGQFFVKAPASAWVVDPRRWSSATPEQVGGLVDEVQLTLDVASALYIGPLDLAGLASAGISHWQGDYVTAAAGVAGAAFGGAFEVYRHVDRVAEATSALRRTSEADDTLKAAADAPKLLGVGAIHRHHLLPRQFEDYFRARDLKIDDYTVQVPELTHHKGIHGRGVGNIPGRWNQRWSEFIEKNPDATAEDIYRELGQLMDEFRISNLPIEPFD